VASAISTASSSFLAPGSSALGLPSCPASVCATGPSWTYAGGKSDPALALNGTPGDYRHLSALGAVAALRNVPDGST